MSASETKQAALDLTRKIFDVQQATLDAASERLAELSGHIDDTVVRIQTAAEESAEAAAATHLGRERLGRVQETLVGLERTLSQLDAAVRQVERIEERSAVIHDIAFQSHVLSVNASIEAARAGEQGRGFSVVASSMRQLAKQSGDAAQEIEAIVHAGVATIQSAALTIKEQLDANCGAIEHLNEAFAAVEERINTLTDTARGLEGASSEQRRHALEIRGELLRSNEDQSRSVSDALELWTGSRVQDVQPVEAFRELARYPIRIDVRTPEEYAHDLGVVDGTLNVPIGADFAERVAPHVREDAVTLVICRRGGRSARACRILQRMGIKTIHNLAGGMLEWTAAGLPTR